MPRQPQIASAADVAASNIYLNALKGRSLPWMTGSNAVGPSPRPRHPSEQQPPLQSLALPHENYQSYSRHLHPLPPGPPANVLPSPTPTDEPSPVGTIIHDSPNPTLPSSDAIEMSEQPGPTANNLPGLPMPGPRFVFATPSIVDGRTTRQNLHQATAGVPSPVPSADALESRSPSMGASHRGPLISPIAVAFPEPQQPLQSNPAPQSGALPLVAPDTPVQSPRVQNGSIIAPAAKRRRVDTPAIMAEAINNHIAQLGGANKIPQLDKSRLRLLLDACEVGDRFFISFHQAFCAWSLGTHLTFTGVPSLTPENIDNAFRILEKILRDNRQLMPVSLQFFANLSGPLSFSTSPAIGYFLLLVSYNWEEVMRITTVEGRPILTSEMIRILGCRSVGLQKVIFTANRRLLGIPDDNLGIQMDRLFFAEQEQANRASEKDQSLVPRSEWPELARRNQTLVSQYRNFVAMARNMASQEQARQPMAHTPIYTPGTTPASGLRLPQIQHPMPTALGGSLRTSQQPYVQSRQTANVGMAIPHHISGQLQQPQQAQHSALYHQPPPHPSVPYHTQPAQQFRRQTFPQAPTGDFGPPPSILYSNANPQAQAAAAALAASGHHFQMSALGPSGRALSFPSQMISQVQEPPPPNPTAGLASRHSATTARTRTAPPPFLPPKGHFIMRHDWAPDPYHEGSIRMSLHQIHLRSPVRTMRVLDRRHNNQVPERYYQFVKGFAAPAILIQPGNGQSYEVDFDLDDKTVGLLSKNIEQNEWGPEVPVCEYFDGSLRFRLRCCRLKDNNMDLKRLSESEWATMETAWPRHIFFRLNATTAVTPRRKQHNGKDLPTELTEHLVGGKNRLQVATLASPHNDLLKQRYALAIEIVETRSHSSISADIWKNRLMKPEETLGVIKKRLGSSRIDEDEEDGLAILVKELSIDLADPFMATIFRIPARGAWCTHLECFDLETWLKTRLGKPSPRACAAHTVNCEQSCRWRVSEPALVDKWRCPICLGDARPNRLVIDGFLLGVRRTLEAQGRLSTKTLLVAPDGSWKPVLEDDDDDEAGSDGDGALSHGRGRSKTRAGTEGRGLRPPGMDRVPEVIDLLDLDD